MAETARKISEPHPTVLATGVFQRFAATPELRLVLLITAAAAAIRLYLVMTSFCISGDGVAYIDMARKFAQGDWKSALSSVFSPLYPLMIAQAYRICPNWELSGDLVSAIFGTATVPIAYYLFREVFESRPVAIGAAALIAIHPALAEYSASVRTEAGFICLNLASLLCLVHGLRRQSVSSIALAGCVGGLAYLYRTEAIGLPIVICAFLVSASLLWRHWNWRAGISSVALYAIAFLLVASPYLTYLHQSTGHWTIGREFTAAMTFGIADMHRDKAQWQQRAWSDETSPLAPVVREPGTWAMKALSDLVWSTYFFGQALGFLLLPFFFVGLWDRRRAILRNPFECLLGGLVIFYVVGLAISYTGPRFMVHLIPYCFGWVSVGLLRLSKEVARAASNLHTSIASESIPIALALVILPQTLWPVGYDLRAFRYLANDLPKSESATIAAVDGRAAFYAQLQFAQLPAPVPGDLCGWIRAQRRIDYLLLSRRDEAVAPASSLNCVRRLKRYPHGRNGHFDLFEIKSPGHG